jgi:hypothetical protein
MFVDWDKSLLLICSSTKVNALYCLMAQALVGLELVSGRTAVGETAVRQDTVLKSTASVGTCKKLLTVEQLTPDCPNPEE